MQSVAPRLEGGIISIDHVLPMEDVLRYDAFHHTSRLRNFQGPRNRTWIRRNDDDGDDNDSHDDLSSSETLLDYASLSSRISFLAECAMD